MITPDLYDFDLETQKNINLWLNGHYDDETKATIKSMLKDNPKQVLDAFFTHLAFGTAGLRGIMGIGTNRMNVYTVRAATQGLANYMLKQPKEQTNLAIFIGYDSRHQSRLFAEETAKVMAGNGIRAYLCKNIRPTPYVSFGVRLQHCLSGVMITASHNPAEYNGYKVYWSDGGQIVPLHDTGIIAEVVKIIDPTLVKTVSSISHPLIEEVEDKVDEAYIQAVNSIQNYPQINLEKGHLLKIVYTSLHGTGITLIPEVFSGWGFNNLSFVDQQIIPDGSFPTVKSPNPEEHAALKLGIEKMLNTTSDLLIATDPDADRVGIAVYHHGETILMNGNQIAAICLEHICEALSQQRRLPPQAAFIKSIVTTELFQAICDSYQRPCFNVLTGFKYIAEKIREWETLPDGYQFIFGAEESYGYLPGTYARDKDAVSTSALICEIALQAKLQGKTLIDRLHDLYQKYGIYFEGVLPVVFEDTKKGKEQIVRCMDYLRKNPLNIIQQIPVTAIDDYAISTKLDLKSGKTSPIPLPASDIIVYWFEDKTKIIIRPSGTEPKIKIYCSLIERTFATISEGLENCNMRCNGLLKLLKELLTSNQTPQDGI